MSQHPVHAIVFVGHSWPASSLGAYGNEWISTPQFDALASESILLEQCFVTDPSPLAFRAFQRQLFESLRSQGITVLPLFDVRHNEGIEKGYESLEEALLEAEKHPKSLVWIETDQLSPPWKVNRSLFEQYAEDCGGLTEGSEPIEGLTPLTSLPENQALTDRDRHQIRCSYASMMSAWDTEFGNAWELLKERGWQEKALCVVCGAFGQDLGEQGQVAAHTLHIQGIHVPFLVHPPSGSVGEAVRLLGMWRWDEVLSLSLAHFFGNPASLPISWPAWFDSQKKQAILCQTGSGSALHTSDWVLHHQEEQRQLFKKPDDYWEMNNLLARLVDWADVLTDYRNRVAECLAIGTPLPVAPDYSTWLLQQPSEETGNSVNPPENLAQNA